jgi:hypothetical protein
MITEHSEREQIELPMPADRMAVALEAVANGIAFAKLADASGVPDDLLGELFARLVLSPDEAAPDEAAPDDTAPDDTAPDETPA